MQRIRTTFGVLLGVLICYSTTPAVRAEEVASSSLPSTYKIQTLDGVAYGDFVVGPAKTELELAPGQSRTVYVSVSNRLGVPTTFSLSVEDMTGSDDPNTPIVLLGQDTGPYTLKDYIHIEQPTFTLPTNEKVSVPVTVTLPSDAEPGGRYGSILVSITSDKPASDDGSARSAVVSRVGALFFVTTPGLDNRSGELTSFGTVPTGKKWYQKGPVTLGLLYENTGDVHVNPYGEIRITNMLGTEVGVIEVDPWYAMPHSVRSREVVFDHTWLFGRYTATAKINRGYNNEIDTMQYTFYVIDWIFVSEIFLGIVVLLFFIRFVTRRFEFRLKRKE